MEGRLLADATAERSLVERAFVGLPSAVYLPNVRSGHLESAASFQDRWPWRSRTLPLGRPPSIRKMMTLGIRPSLGATLNRTWINGGKPFKSKRSWSWMRMGRSCARQPPRSFLLSERLQPRGRMR